MGLRLAGARAVSALSAWALKNIFRRPAANFPGKIALYLDPKLIADLSGKLSKGSIIITGTNGKTTVTNLLADVLETAGARVITNRTGANLDSGVATALLQGTDSDWGIFENDELWVTKVLPQLKSDYLLLLNLFRDQLDRVGEIDVIQDSIIAALSSSPGTTLIYNADDPLCTAIALKVENRKISFGLGEPLELEQNTVVDAQMCQMCSGMLRYRYRQYGQLGDYYCSSCDFGRQTLDFVAHDIALRAGNLSFEMSGKGETMKVQAQYGGAYMIYNLLASSVAAYLLGASSAAFSQALAAFDPQNGRLQHFFIEGRQVLLNLAKNPIGFNQNLGLIREDTEQKTVAFFVNDKEGDGRDVSWLWDVDFEELNSSTDTVYVGGIRRNELQLRLKYADIPSDLIDGITELLESGKDEGSLYVVANYTALPSVHEELVNMARRQGSSVESEHQGRGR